MSEALFYPKSRIVPWDWTRIRTEESVKTGPKDPQRPTVFFAGALTESKGVGDCLRAVSLLKKRGIDLAFALAGPGDFEFWRAQTAELGVSDRVVFLGVIGNDDVRRRMSESDIVVVPSRYDYAEGLPNTIYEALASRTPLVVSDHPAYASRMRSGKNCLIFRAADALSLADQIAALLSDAALFCAPFGTIPDRA